MCSSAALLERFLKGWIGPTTGSYPSYTLSYLYRRRIDGRLRLRQFERGGKLCGNAEIVIVNNGNGTTVRQEVRHQERIFPGFYHAFRHG